MGSGWKQTCETAAPPFWHWLPALYPRAVACVCCLKFGWQPCSPRPLGVRPVGRYGTQLTFSGQPHDTMALGTIRVAYK